MSEVSSKRKRKRLAYADDYEWKPYAKEKCRKLRNASNLKKEEDFKKIHKTIKGSVKQSPVKNITDHGTHTIHEVQEVVESMLNTVCSNQKFRELTAEATIEKNCNWCYVASLIGDDLSCEICSGCKIGSTPNISEWRPKRKSPGSEPDESRNVKKGSPESEQPPGKEVLSHSPNLKTVTAKMHSMQLSSPNEEDSVLNRAKKKILGIGSNLIACNQDSVQFECPMLSRSKGKRKEFPGERNSQVTCNEGLLINDLLVVDSRSEASGPLDASRNSISNQNQPITTAQKIIDDVQYGTYLLPPTSEIVVASYTARGAENGDPYMSGRCYQSEDHNHITNSEEVTVSVQLESSFPSNDKLPVVNPAKKKKLKKSFNASAYKIKVRKKEKKDEPNFLGTYQNEKTTAENAPNLSENTPSNNTNSNVILSVSSRELLSFPFSDQSSEVSEIFPLSFCESRYLDSLPNVNTGLNVDNASFENHQQAPLSPNDPTTYSMKKDIAELGSTPNTAKRDSKPKNVVFKFDVERNVQKCSSKVSEIFPLSSWESRYLDSLPNVNTGLNVDNASFENHQVPLSPNDPTTYSMKKDIAELGSTPNTAKNGSKPKGVVSKLDVERNVQKCSSKHEQLSRNKDHNHLTNSKKVTVSVQLESPFPSNDKLPVLNPAKKKKLEKSINVSAYKIKVRKKKKKDEPNSIQFTGLMPLVSQAKREQFTGEKNSLVIDEKGKNCHLNNDFPGNASETPGSLETTGNPCNQKQPITTAQTMEDDEQFGTYILPPTARVVVANYTVHAQSGDYYLSSVRYQNEVAPADNAPDLREDVENIVTSPDSLLGANSTEPFLVQSPKVPEISSQTFSQPRDLDSLPNISTVSKVECKLMQLEQVQSAPNVPTIYSMEKAIVKLGSTPNTSKRKSKAKDFGSKPGKRKSKAKDFGSKPGKRKSKPRDLDWKPDKRKSKPKDLDWKPDKRKSKPKDLGSKRGAEKNVKKSWRKYELRSGKKDHSHTMILKRATVEVHPDQPSFLSENDPVLNLPGLRQNISKWRSKPKTLDAKHVAIRKPKNGSSKYKKRSGKKDYSPLTNLKTVTAKQQPNPTFLSCNGNLQIQTIEPRNSKKTTANIFSNPIKKNPLVPFDEMLYDLVQYTENDVPKTFALGDGRENQFSEITLKETKNSVSVPVDPTASTDTGILTSVSKETNQHLRNEELKSDKNFAKAPSVKEMYCECFSELDAITILGVLDFDKKPRISLEYFSKKNENEIERWKGIKPTTEVVEEKLKELEDKQIKFELAETLLYRYGSFSRLYTAYQIKIENNLEKEKNLSSGQITQTQSSAPYMEVMEQQQINLDHIANIKIQNSYSLVVDAAQYGTVPTTHVITPLNESRESPSTCICGSMTPSRPESAASQTDGLRIEKKPKHAPDSPTSSNRRPYVTPSASPVTVISNQTAGNQFDLPAYVGNKTQQQTIPVSNQPHQQMPYVSTTDIIDQPPHQMTHVNNQPHQPVNYFHNQPQQQTFHVNNQAYMSVPNSLNSFHVLDKTNQMLQNASLNRYFHPVNFVPASGDPPTWQLLSCNDRQIQEMRQYRGWPMAPQYTAAPPRYQTNAAAGMNELQVQQERMMYPQGSPLLGESPDRDFFQNTIRDQNMLGAQQIANKNYLQHVQLNQDIPRPSSALFMDNNEHTPISTYAPMSCAACNTIPAPFRCLQCSKVFYCTPRCAEFYWHLRHKNECT